MCGRTCLTLDPDQVLCACKYTTTHTKENPKKSPKLSDQKEDIKKEVDVDTIDNYLTPEWRAEFNCGRIYQPSYNIAPTDITPVLVSTDHFRDTDSKYATETEQKRVVVPMMWGMIPFWHKGDYRKHGLTTNNCRLEHMLESKLYRGPFSRGQRCVVLCEGFYEWQTTKSAKPSERAAHLVFVPQEESVKIYDKTTWSANNVKLLKMAGLFDVWEDDNGDKIYSYSIITFESTKIMSWMHHRMPAILETEQQVNDWLDYKRVTDKVALATLCPATALKWHRVTNLVNNSRNKSDQCNKPIELAEKPKKPPMNKTMLAWLNTRKQREEQLEAVSSEQSDEDSPTSSNSDKRKSSGSDDSHNVPSKRQRFRE